MEKYRVLDEFYSSPVNQVVLKHGVVEATGRKVVIKLISGVSESDYTLIVKEGENQQRLNQHPYVCKVLDFFRVQADRNFQVVLVLEKCSYDLSALLQFQQKRRENFEESFLWKVLSQCVNALAFGQDFVRHMQNICHRDVKPNNVLLGEDDNVRVCDFGSSRRIEESLGKYTLQGTPQFLSPLLRQQLSFYLVTNKLVKVAHNPFKSDVFSLGYTMLILALLRDTDCGRNSDNMQANITAEISSVRYSDDFKRILHFMMAVEEANRPDFRDLREYLKQNYESQFPRVEIQKCALYEWHTFACVESTDAPVQLHCSPHHVFCSKHCFLEYVFIVTGNYSKLLNTVLCPQCKAPIDTAMIYEALGGRDEYERQRKLLTHCCVNCTNYTTTRKFQCYHRVCSRCWKQIRQMKQCPEEDCRAARKRDKCPVF